ncbi:MAG: HD domain-containing protein [Patescibacteria group bacterium]
MLKTKIEKFNIPENVSHVTSVLKKAGFEAYLVGGCVRDLFMNRKPKDWDITTSAIPEEIMPLFKKTVYENSFGTVAIVNEEEVDEDLKIIEITPYRLENSYSDHRRPDKVQFSKNILDDLKRRDFTINAIAYDPETGDLVDPFYGVADLAHKTIKCVGNPKERFSEDGLRILRAIRLHVELDFPIDPDTEKAITENGYILKEISKERVRDEMTKIIMSERPMAGFLILKKLGLLEYTIPQLEKTIGIEQKGVHIYDVWTHLLKSLQHSADKKYPLEVRLAALFHDISKPESRRFNKELDKYTFYGHEVLGSRVTERILTDLRFSRETIKKVSNLVRWHMFFSDTEQITLSAVRRMIVNVGKENVWDLVNVRMCDRIGTGRPKESPYRLRKYKSMIEEAMRDPISVSMLKVDGKTIMNVLQTRPGPIVGYILNILLNEVLDDPLLNKEDYLIKRTKELGAMSFQDLDVLSKKGLEKKDVLEKIEIKNIRARHKVS